MFYIDFVIIFEMGMKAMKDWIEIWNRVSWFLDRNLVYDIC